MFSLRFAIGMLLVSCSSWVIGAQVHHIVGGDGGWDTDSGIESWSSGRIFSVGDKLWFTYSVAQENIVELRSRQEYDSCDLTNPIKMYTDGISSLLLNEQGLRYFASSNSKNCKNGLKLHIDVQPKSPGEIQGVAMSENSVITLAVSPSSPSSSSHLKVDLAKVGGALVCLFVLYYAVAI